MNNQLNIIRRLLNVGGLMAFVLLLTAMAWGQSSLKATGEIAAASQTTINGASVVSGMTVFNNNRIRTGGQGTAIINLGRLGRIEFGPNTDMTLRLSREGIGGDLHSNHVVVSARAGVPISIKTPKGMITTDGRQPAALTIDVENKSARVTTHLGEANVTSRVEEDRANVERVAAGEVLFQSPSSTGWQHIGPVTGAIAATKPTQVDQITSPVRMTATPNASTFPELFNAGISYSIGPESGEDRNTEAPFETSITCFNNFMMPCRKKSEFKP